MSDTLGSGVGSRAPAAASQRHRVTLAPHRAAEEASRPFGRVPHGAASAANDGASIRTPFGDHCRKRDAIAAVKDRYWSLKNKLAERMEREIARIEREGV